MPYHLAMAPYLYLIITDLLAFCKYFIHTLTYTLYILLSSFHQFRETRWRLNHYRLGQALDRLVTVSCTRCRASTSVLSTSCSSRGLRLATGDLILRGASRLDAFSVYPVRTWLLCRAFGNTTDTPAVRPPRSSRTKGSSSQISCARAG